VRRQEVVEERPQCFRYRKRKHKKWECPERNEKRREEEALPHKVWEKIKQYCGIKELSLRKAIMSMEG